ncbi:hypothetical protein DL98DRAFT_644419 [Cadophora sp. DSE1049]|nr:hypothetical protein DL98DRAFT_644419 [Cadophora sp. DSE1049]
MPKTASTQAQPILGRNDILHVRDTIMLALKVRMKRTGRFPFRDSALRFSYLEDCLRLSVCLFLPVSYLEAPYHFTSGVSAVQSSPQLQDIPLLSPIYLYTPELIFVYQLFCFLFLANMALPDRYPPPSPHRSSYLPPAHPSSSYSERSPRFRGPALADVEAAVRSNAQRLDSPWQDTQNHPPRWISNEDHYNNDYLPGPASSTSLSPSERPEPSPPLSSNAPFYVPRSPPSVIPHPKYQGRPDHRMDIDPAAGYEYDYRVQYHPGYQLPLLSEQHLPPSYLQTPMPIYDQQPQWSGSGPPDRQPSPERSRPQPFIHGQGQPPRERERLAPLRPPPPPQAVGMQRSYSQGRHARALSSSRRNPYPPNDGRGRVSSSSRYQGGGKRRFEKRSGYVQRGSGY